MYCTFNYLFFIAGRMDYNSNIRCIRIAVMKNFMSVQKKERKSCLRI